ncbi:MAG: hypothetical protein QNK04_06395 [Myxococcota bacterium]|nr:hypothetical protein [Myxococcota bacterium]
MATDRERKDRLIQTRVPRDLEATLKSEARRRRVTVSHLIRNVLEDAFDLVDGVVADVDRLVADSVTLARNVGENARRLADPKRARPGEDGADLEDVYAWNEVVLHRAATCSGCGADIARGERAHVGLSDGPARSRAWLCPTCITALGEP